MDEDKRIYMTRKGIIWYTVFSFLLVTLLIFTAVMITYNAAVKKIGATYAKQLAVASKGFELDDVTDLDIKKTYFDGNAVFEVSFNKDSEKHIVYVDTETARIANKSTGAPATLPETPASPGQTSSDGEISRR